MQIATFGYKERKRQPTVPAVLSVETFARNFRRKSFSVPLFLCFSSLLENSYNNRLAENHLHSYRFSKSKFIWIT